MKQYLDLCQDVLENGVKKTDRTGTGTISVFSRDMRFDLSKGFPMVTTKKVNFNAILHELLWFLSGDTNIKYLVDNGVNIWNGDAYREYKKKKNGYKTGLSMSEYVENIKNDDKFAELYGDLGRIYQSQWRCFGSEIVKIPQKQPNLNSSVKPTYLGVANGKGKSNSKLGKTWEGMIARCYDENSPSYHLYGARGVYVCDRWLEFSKFEEDAIKLAGWIDFDKRGDTKLALDKDKLGNGFVYSPETCCWLTHHDNNPTNLKQDKIYTVEKNGVQYSFSNISEFCREHNIKAKNFSDLWTKNKNAKTRSGFTLVNVVDKRKKGIDQIRNVINSIKTNPDGRRHLVSAWNPNELDMCALPPCHFAFQFYVANGKLSCKFFMRSNDVFLGLPFNIASYALLTHMVAQVCNLEVGELVYSGTDVHIYQNHIEQVKLQLTREPYPLPTIKINPNVKDINDFRFDDFELVGYQHHPFIKGALSV